MQHLVNGQKMAFCVTFESPGVISTTVRTRMNHFDSEAVSLSCSNESHTPVDKLISVVSIFACLEPGALPVCSK